MLKHIIKFSVITGVLFILLIAGYWYYQHQKFYPSTDDAYIQANIVKIAPQVSGTILKTFIEDQQHVKKGQLLFEIDPTPFIASLNQSKANLNNTEQQVKALRAAVVTAKALVAQRQAELTDAAKQTNRILSLVKRNLYSKQQGDTAIRDLKVAKAALHSAQSQLIEAQERLGKLGNANAQIRAAQAEVTQAKIKLSYTKVYSPINGQITQFTLHKGTGVSAYELLFSIVDEDQWWVSANFKETNLERIRPGQEAKVVIDMYPHHSFKGTITSIAPGSGASFALLPPENATGNWVKVTQRFPVRIALSEINSSYPFRIGASCTVTVDTRTLP